MADILSEVLDAVRLRAVRVERSRVTASLRGAAQGRDAAACYVVLEGCFRFRIAGGERRLLRHDALWLRATPEFSIACDAESGTLLRCDFRFDLEVPHPLLEMPPVVGVNADAITDETELGQVVRLLEAELLNGRVGADLVGRRLADVLAVEVLRRYQRQAAAAPFLGALADPAIRAAVAAIHGEPRRRWRLDELAAASGLSRGVFAERFHELVGEPPLGYLRRWRLLQAQRGLREGDAQINEIAARAGYRSASGFRRAFRRMFGTAPAEYRRGR